MTSRRVNLTALSPFSLSPLSLSLSSLSHMHKMIHSPITNAYTVTESYLEEITIKLKLRFGDITLYTVVDSYTKAMMEFAQNAGRLQQMIKEFCGITNKQSEGEWMKHFTIAYFLACFLA